MALAFCAVKLVQKISFQKKPKEDAIDMYDFSFTISITSFNIIVLIFEGSTENRRLMSTTCMERMTPQEHRVIIAS